MRTNLKPQALNPPVRVLITVLAKAPKPQKTYRTLRTLIESLQTPYRSLSGTIGASIIRIGFGGIFYYNYNKEPEKP